MKIKFETELDEKLVFNILKALDGGHDVGEMTFMRIADAISYDLRLPDAWVNLKLHLMYMEKQKLIEERHHSNSDINGMVDYSLENAGIEYLREHQI